MRRLALLAFALAACADPPPAPAPDVPRSLIACDSRLFEPGHRFLSCVRPKDGDTWTCDCVMDGRTITSCESPDGCVVPNCCGFQ